MRHLSRWTFNTLAVLSLMLCVATCLLWVRSWSTPDQVSRWRERPLGEDRSEFTVLDLTSGGGRVAAEFRQSVVYRPGGGDDAGGHWTLCHADDFTPELRGGFWRRHGLFFDGTFRRPRTDAGASNVDFLPPVACAVGTPYWLPAVVFAGLPMLGLARRGRRWWRGRRGVCRSCGYDLTGNVTGVCSECGAVVRTARRSGI